MNRFRRISRLAVAAIAALGCGLLASCRDAHSVLAPVSEEAAGIARIWWIFLAVCTAVYLVIVALVVMLLKKPRDTAAQMPASLTPEPQAERRTHRLIVMGAGVTTVILLGLLLADLWVERGLGPRKDPLTIRLTGHQWWWAAEYQNPNASDVFETANELHVPVGRPVQLLLESSDVIHSFWVPQIHGKRDLVPGHPGAITFQVDRPGRFEGQCAEFCGFQHAHMAIVIVAEPPEQFEAWARTERKSAPEPVTDNQRRGRDLFEHATCAMCHTVQGTSARSRVGPALTHLAGRKTLGAGVAPNNRGQLARWISDPHDLKPGVRMPPHRLSTDNLNALLD